MHGIRRFALAIALVTFGCSSSPSQDGPSADAGNETSADAGNETSAPKAAFTVHVDSVSATATQDVIGSLQGATIAFQRTDGSWATAQTNAAGDARFGSLDGVSSSFAVFATSSPFTISATITKASDGTASWKVGVPISPFGATVAGMVKGVTPGRTLVAVPLGAASIGTISTSGWVAQIKDGTPTSFLAAAYDAEDRTIIDWVSVDVPAVAQDDTYRMDLNFGSPVTASSVKVTAKAAPGGLLTDCSLAVSSSGYAVPVQSTYATDSVVAEAKIPDLPAGIHGVFTAGYSVTIDGAWVGTSVVAGPDATITSYPPPIVASKVTGVGYGEKVTLDGVDPEADVWIDIGQWHAQLPKGAKELVVPVPPADVKPVITRAMIEACVPLTGTPGACARRQALHVELAH